MTSLKEDAKLVLDMWESWKNLEPWGLNPQLDTDDSRVVDVKVLYRAVFVLVHENIADLDLQTEINNIHRKEPVPNWNEATFWNWYEYWLSIFKGTKPTPTKLKLSTFVADDVRMQDALQQYTCAVLSHYLNIKYGLCILAATYPKQNPDDTFVTENLVERMGWTATMQKDQAKVQAPFMVSQIYAYATRNPELKGKMYVTVTRAVANMGKTIPEVLTLPPLDPPKPPNGDQPKPPTPPTDSGGGMGILFIVLLLLAAAVTFSKK